MTKIDLNDGVLYLKGRFFPSKVDNEYTHSHMVGKNLYSNMSINCRIKNIPFTATGYYKNKKLKSINLYLNDKFLVDNYKTKNKVDFRDYYSHYLSFCKDKTEELIYELINTKQRKFNWGKIQIQIDPKCDFVFAEIIYYK